MKDNDLVRAIEYALRVDGFSVISADEDGEFEIGLDESDAETMLPFVKRLLLELKVGYDNIQT